ncbi:small multi-drug export protein [Methanoculleus sp. FWC-SCC1]|uniref:Small multi-drug export protein n=1 Tax=Methanoculleus frigidifontis TaxID=2584085 RepID=A0ABT8MB19_9EURY|nr:small multi-drug export protein [Methanoculleus sp. FWC-SCC1]MDN7025144.1 small multi-drug export protein [Methanoculleus sp. FWC-SCC1]
MELSGKAVSAYLQARGPVAYAATKFVLPLAIIPLILGLLYLTLPHGDFLFFAGLSAGYFIPPFGKESIIPIAILAGHPWWLIVTLLVALDAAVALFIVWNFDLALKIPLIGGLLERGLTMMSTYTREHPGLRNVSTIGLFLFVFFPFQGTGAMNGSILGRLLGMDAQRVFACVMAGSVTSCLIIALGTDVILDLYRDSPLLGIAVLLLAALAAAAAYLGWRRHQRRLRERVR